MNNRFKQMSDQVRDQHATISRLVCCLTNVLREAFPHVQSSTFAEFESAALAHFAGDLEKHLEQFPRPAKVDPSAYLERLIRERDELTDQIGALDRVAASPELPQGISDYVEAMGGTHTRNRLADLEKEIDKVIAEIQKDARTDPDAG